MTETVKELGEAKDLTCDEFIRTLVGQCFENDNDTTTLKVDLEAADGSTSNLEFMIRVLSINGIKTREES